VTVPPWKSARTETASSRASLCIGERDPRGPGRGLGSEPGPVRVAGDQDLACPAPGACGTRSRVGRLLARPRRGDRPPSKHTTTLLHRRAVRQGRSWSKGKSASLRSCACCAPQIREGGVDGHASEKPFGS
jgi:hypothetical protein